MLSANISKFNKSVLPIIAFILNVIFIICACFLRTKKETREKLCINPYSVQMRENTDQNNSEYGHFLRSV